MAKFQNTGISIFIKQDKNVYFELKSLALWQLHVF